ncbi:MAG: septum site-determining protein MinC [Deltaproteobacteria bacterium]|nr:MAG: septum site-determining protein MinC [Deltaproteobacteria bacterium]
MTTAHHTAAPSQSLFKLKGSSLTLMVLYLLEEDTDRLVAQLQSRYAAMPGFFRNAPLLIDGTLLPEDRPGPEFAPLLAAVRPLGLVPTALRGGSARLQQAALAAGLGLVAGEPGDSQEGAAPEPAAPSPAAQDREAPPPPPATRIVNGTVRSGQRVVSKGDLIVHGAVNPGAELLAHGSIHVYGTLRGRALAGLHGDDRARVCALQFHPELVAVAGEYLLFDELAPNQRGACVSVSKDGDTLRVDTLGTFTPAP